MATNFRVMNKALRRKEPNAARRTIYFEVGTDEAQTVTVSKAGGAFAATAGSAASKVDGTLYKLVIDPDDLDTIGEVAFKCAGATDTQYIIGLSVVEYSPYDAGALTDKQVRYRASMPR